MPLDPKWAAFAENDLLTAEILMREGIHNQVCFHAQQSVEKYLKGSIPPASRPRTHKIVDLLALTPIPLSEELQRD